ncbi:MAG: hypothetical protein HGA19_19360 [Oscillochloris sp.]|nr:hypothetical protein [Oscillochloris sp.]
MESIKDHQVCHLFITVGGNPLPCVVAGRLLLKEGGTVHLIYSTASKDSADGICQVLGASMEHAVALEDCERDSDEVYKRVCAHFKKIPDKESVGLHYTGGTKVMAVHAYRAVKASCPNAIFSYLDPQRIELAVERSGPSVDKRFLLIADPLRKHVAVALTLDDLWKLHRVTLLPSTHKEFSTRYDPVFRTVPQMIGKAFAVGGRDQWNRAVNGLKSDSSIDGLPFINVIESIRLERPDIRTVADLKRVPGCRGFSWLQGDWLEDYVLTSLKQIAPEIGFNDGSIACSIITQRTDGKKRFEVDVIAMRGYQLFVFSCVASDDMGKCKQKLFEASHRASQLGGDEARFALVCAHDDGDEVREQIATLLPAEHFRVFDRHDLEDLPVEIAKWIRKCG